MQLDPNVVRFDPGMCMCLISRSGRTVRAELCTQVQSSEQYNCVPPMSHWIALPYRSHDATHTRFLGPFLHDRNLVPAKCCFTEGVSSHNSWECQLHGFVLALFVCQGQYLLCYSARLQHIGLAKSICVGRAYFRCHHQARD